ncbi:MAG: hypothetical protein D6698_06785 [Gammaproteobacteria bacterium]|nr:MAG: hypothetical protein D6698_06785 [Gammaproteobacteria bacterium]
MSELKIRDTQIIEQPIGKRILGDAKNRLDSSGDDTALEISVNSTHSGLLANNRVYPGVFVRKSYKSYFSRENGGTAEFDKPVLTHHDHQSDPIGRIIGGKFTALKTGDDFRRDYLKPGVASKGESGSGVVTIKARITDPDAIDKILDGRYLSVSSGQSSPVMTCSVCSKPLLSAFDRIFGGGSDKACEHLPGKVYEDEKGRKRLCYAITGPLTYHEVSFVTIPAQPGAKVVSTDWEELKDGDADLIEFTERANRSIISEMTLIDGNGDEMNLLVNRRNKVLVAVPKAAVESLEDFMNSLLEDDELSQKGTGDSRHPTDATDDEDIPEGDADDGRLDRDSDSEGSDTNDKLAQPTKRDRMTKEVEKLQATVDSLSEEKKTLQGQITQKDEEIATLKEKLEEKEEELSRVMEDLQKMQSDVAKDYATLVAQYRILLKKPGTEDIKDDESLAAYVDSLAERTVQSLRDTLQDLSLELDTSSLTVTKTDKNPSLVSDKKVTPDGESDDTNTPDRKDLLGKLIL